MGSPNRRTCGRPLSGFTEAATGTKGEGGEYESERPQPASRPSGWLLRRADRHRSASGPGFGPPAVRISLDLGTFRLRKFDRRRDGIEPAPYRPVAGEAIAPNGNPSVWASARALVGSAESPRGSLRCSTPAARGRGSGRPEPPRGSRGLLGACVRCGHGETPA
jgi:hypothetical protein